MAQLLRNQPPFYQACMVDKLSVECCFQIHKSWLVLLHNIFVCRISYPTAYGNFIHRQFRA
jgi:hypothetical protein